MSEKEILENKLLVSKILFLNHVSIDDAKVIGNFIEELEQENKKQKEKVEYQKNKIDNKDRWCQLIADIGFDYDGCNTIEGLKGLIDELVNYALDARDNLDYEDILKGDKDE